MREGEPRVWQTRWGKLKMASAPFITSPQKTASLPPSQWRWQEQKPKNLKPTPQNKSKNSLLRLLTNSLDVKGQPGQKKILMGGSDILNLPKVQTQKPLFETKSKTAHCQIGCSLSRVLWTVSNYWQWWKRGLVWQALVVQGHVMHCKKSLLLEFSNT